MSEYCSECGAHENDWGKGPVMDELTNEISHLRALLERALIELRLVGQEGTLLYIDIDAALRRDG